MGCGKTYSDGLSSGARNTGSARLDGTGSGGVDGRGGHRGGCDGSKNTVGSGSYGRNNGSSGGNIASLVDEDSRIGVGIGNETVNRAVESASTLDRVVRGTDAVTKSRAGVNAVNDPVVAESGLASDHASLADRNDGAVNVKTAADEVLATIGVEKDLIIVGRADERLGVREGAVGARVVGGGGHGSTVVGTSGGRESRTSGGGGTVSSSGRSGVVGTASDSGEGDAGGSTS